jgi:hypothetical protein
VSLRQTPIERLLNITIAGPENHGFSREVRELLEQGFGFLLASELGKRTGAVDLGFGVAGVDLQGCFQRAQRGKRVIETPPRSNVAGARFCSA